ncbi:MAG: hypothetical protein ABI877_13670 [Gemmatimonadaceae bacterium]
MTRRHEVVRRRSHRTAVLLLWALGLPACRPAPYAATASRYVYIWAGDKDEKDSDFLAVVDVRPQSATYGEVIATEPVGMTGSLPHHLEYELPDSGQLLFANGHHHEAIFLFDSRVADHPRLVRTLPPVAPYRFPHDMVRLPNRHLLVGYLRSDGPSPLPSDSTMPGGHGGIAELDTNGVLLRSASAADSAFQVPIRPYSFAILPAIDRVVMTSAVMMEDTSADVLQFWRLSDFHLLRTLQVPPALLPNGRVLPHGHGLPFEPRVMPDGSVLLNAYGCGFYRVTDIDQATPRIENVYSIDVPPEQMGACGVPVVVGHYWIMTVGSLHALVTLDIEDPARPREVSRLLADTTFRPHWAAKDPGANRMIVGAENGGENRMLMARIDTTTGRLSWDTSLHSADGGLGISFQRAQWPHGSTGEAFGHAALFRR